jgi:hypothetical protein
MQDSQAAPDETTGAEPAESTRMVSWPKRGVAPALRSAAYPDPRHRPPAASRVTTRDLRLLRWAGEQHGARLDHLQALTGTSMTRVRSLVSKLCAAGLLRTERIVADQRAWAIPTAEGLAACDLSYDVWTPTLGQVTHVGAVNDVRIHVQTQTPQADWLSERQLAAEYEGVDSGRSSGRRKHLPDGVAILEGRGVAIEVELTIKANRRLEEILDELTGRYERVMYFCAPGPHKQLTRLERSGRWPSLGVRELPELPRPRSRW